MMVEKFYIGLDTLTSNMTASSAYSTVLCACQKTVILSKGHRNKQKG